MYDRRTDIDGDAHLQNTPVSHISKLIDYCALLISIAFVLLFLIKQYVLETILLRKLYGARFTNLNETQRRSFINHHIAGGTKSLILIIAVYPFINVTFRYAELTTPYTKGSSVTLGDILVIATEMLCAMYVFELIYRVRISPISALHHIGTIIIGQTAITISLNLIQEKDATIEFILCTVWGAFDIVCELLPHISMILYRVFPTSHVLLSHVFLIAALTTFGGTIFETAIVMYLFGSLWQRWTFAFKIVTPLLHIAFSTTQLHGSRIHYCMWRRQRKLILQEGLEDEHPEAGT